jgi:hypothetical protein
MMSSATARKAADRGTAQPARDARPRIDAALANPDAPDARQRNVPVR